MGCKNQQANNWGVYPITSKAISGTDLLEVPTIYVWPMFQAYVSGYTSKYGQKYGTNVPPF